MAEIFKTLKEVGVVMGDLTTALVAGGPTVDRISLAWQTIGTPAFGIDQNVIYISVVEKDIAYNKQRETSYTAEDNDIFVQHTVYTRGLSVAWTIYGPDSYTLSQMIRDYIYYQENHDLLAWNNIFMVPSIEAARRVPELFVGQWWERVDINIEFYELIVRERKSASILSAEITTQSDKGLISDTVITQ